MLPVPGEAGAPGAAGVPGEPEPGAVVLAPAGVTVSWNDACGVESPLESCARHDTVCAPTKNSPPDGKLHTRLYGGYPPLTENEYDTGAQFD